MVPRGATFPFKIYSFHEGEEEWEKTGDFFIMNIRISLIHSLIHSYLFLKQINLKTAPSSKSTQAKHDSPQWSEQGHAGYQRSIM